MKISQNLFITSLIMLLPDKQTDKKNSIENRTFLVRVIISETCMQVLLSLELSLLYD